MLLGNEIVFTDEMFINTFINSLSEREMAVFKVLLNCANSYDQDQLNDIINIMSRFDCRKVPRDSSELTKLYFKFV
jgi:hypothetical protein